MQEDTCALREDMATVKNKVESTAEALEGRLKLVNELDQK